MAIIRLWVQSTCITYSIVVPLSRRSMILLLEYLMMVVLSYLNDLEQIYPWHLDRAAFSIILWFPLETFDSIGVLRSWNALFGKDFQLEYHV